MKESKIERDSRKLAEAQGYWLLKILALNFVGFPDRVLLGPGPTIAFCEFKRSKSAARSKMQERRIDKLQSWGFRAEFVDSVEQFEEILNQ